MEDSLILYDIITVQKMNEYLAHQEANKKKGR